METSEKLKMLLITLKSISPGVDQPFMIKCNEQRLLSQCRIANEAELTALLSHLGGNKLKYIIGPIYKKGPFGENYYTVTVTVAGFLEAEKLMKENDNCARNKVPNTINIGNRAIVNIGDNSQVTATTSSIIINQKELFDNLRKVIVDNGEATGNNNEVMLKSLQAIENAIKNNDRKTLFSRFTEFMQLTANMTVITKYSASLGQLVGQILG